MLRVDCDKCGENIFEVPDESFMAPLPKKITCLGCARRYLVQLNEKGQLVYSRMGRKKVRLPKVV